MFVGIGMNLVRGGTSASPASLFAASEPGVWYDPSDLSTLFQDNLGATPVTAPAQTVGLMLDKSQGLALGSELVTNGDFASGTGWTLSTGWVISGGAATFTATGANAAIQQTGSTSSVAGRTYILTYNVTANSLNAGTLRVGGFSGGSFFGSSAITIPSSVGPQTARVLVSAPSGAGTVFDFWINNAATSGSITIDNISVKLLAGNHATQATLAQRPTYGINPITGTRNLLTYTEQFDNAVWGVTSATVSTNATTAPDGSLTADQIVETSGSSLIPRFAWAQTIANSTQYVLSVYAKEVPGSQKRYLQIWINSGFPTAIGSQGANFDLGAGIVTLTAGFTASITPVGDGWHRCSVFTNVSNATVAGMRIGLQESPTANMAQFWNPTGLGSMFIWGAQLETGSTATAYQKVVSQYEVTQAGVQSVSYLAFDGVDDGMVTNTITPESALTPTGPELVTNGDFASGSTGWTDISGAWAVTGGVLQGTSVGASAYGPYSNGTDVVAGLFYSATFTLTVTSGGLFARVGNDQSAAYTSSGTYTKIFQAVTTGVSVFQVRASGSGFTGSIDNISVRAVSGVADKVQVFAGVRKLSDAAIGVIAELGTGSGNGLFFLAGSRSATGDYGFFSKGTVGVDAQTPNLFSAPITNILTGLGDISGDISRIRVNGGNQVTTTTDQGTGNYLAYPIYIGRRGGASLPYNGRLYSLITRFGANLTDGQITATETWVNGETGAY